jgi:exodeoxyribonuclease VII small subunit
LEQIATMLDRDDISLEQALVLFEEGIAKLREATSALADAEGRVATLIEHAQSVFEVRE